MLLIWILLYWFMIHRLRKRVSIFSIGFNCSCWCSVVEEQEGICWCTRRSYCCLALFWAAWIPSSYSSVSHFDSFNYAFVFVVQCSYLTSQVRFCNFLICCSCLCALCFCLNILHVMLNDVVGLRLAFLCFIFLKSRFWKLRLHWELRSITGLLHCVILVLEKMWRNSSLYVTCKHLVHYFIACQIFVLLT